MHAKNDHNALVLLSYVTEECLLCYQMMYYWQSSYSAAHGSDVGRVNTAGTPSGDVSRHASSNLMEELVLLWELTMMNPYISEEEKGFMKLRLQEWNTQLLEAARKG